MKIILKLALIIVSVSAMADGAMKYGEKLSIVKNLGIGRCNDATVVKNKLYVVGGGNLHIFDINDPVSPVKLGRLRGLGMTRQIAIKDNVAYITSREDGLYIVDVSNAKKPKLVSIYDTIELATGIALAGDVAFVACRHYGVELIDISNPKKPLHLSSVRTGEAQSLAYFNNYIYVGVWGSSELVVCDVKNPRKPRVAAKAKLDGFADGVFVKGKYCYVATGHHSRTRGKQRHGHGHGMEIFDISNPEKPEFVSRIKAPPKFYIGYDMWDVKVVGKYAFLGDTWNGIFVIDISNHEKPFFVANGELPKVKIKSRKGQYNSPVTSFALGKGCIYVAGGFSDLHVFKASMARPVKENPGVLPTIPPLDKSELKNGKYRIYKPDGQVYAVAFSGDTAMVAAGNSGLHVIKLWPKIEKLAEYKTDGFCMDVKVFGDYVYVAEGKGGLSIWKIKNASLLELAGRYKAGRRAIKQVVVPTPGKYALLQIAAYSLHIVDISNPESPRLALKDSRHGLLYGYQITDGLLDKRYACCFWHVSGFFWYDLNSVPVKYTGNNNPYRVGASNGMAIYKDKCLVTNKTGKYLLFGKDETAPIKDLPSYGVKGCKLTGKPSIYGNNLYLSDRASGDVTFCDITDVRKPKLLRKFKFKGNPGIIAKHNECPIIPCGYQGLLVFKK